MFFVLFNFLQLIWGCFSFPGPLCLDTRGPSLENPNLRIYALWNDMSCIMVLKNTCTLEKMSILSIYT